MIFLTLILSILSIAVGAFMSGTFSVPFARVEGWKWEHSWLAFSFFAYLVFPALLCMICCPGFTSIITQADSRVLITIFLYGAAYGICNMTFGLSLKYMGLALGYALSLGLMMLLGTLLPPLIDGRMSTMLASDRAAILFVGLAVSLAGITAMAIAGYRKEKQQSNPQEEEESRGDVRGRTFLLGLAMCLFVGVTGSTQALGIESGTSLVNEVNKMGVNSLFSTLPTFLVLYAGSFLTTLIGCILLSIHNKSLGNITHAPLGRNVLFCSLAGLLWFINYLFYGMGKSLMGEYSFIAWGILMSLTILSATVWGIWRGEWKTADGKSRITMYAGLLLLVIASFLIGLSGK